MLLLPLPSIDASSLLKAVYNPKAVIPHAALLHQAFAHCAIFPTAASRRSLGRISVPVWPVALSGRLPVDALVGHYLTNKLIGREPILDRKSFPPTAHASQVISGISTVSDVIPKSRAGCSRVTHPFATNPRSEVLSPFDLHVLSTPPAFVLSQDQTLRRNLSDPTRNSPDCCPTRLIADKRPNAGSIESIKGIRTVGSAKASPPEYGVFCALLWH